MELTIGILFYSTCKGTQCFNHFKLTKGNFGFKDAFDAFVNRHPIAKKWLRMRGAVLCRLSIERIVFVDTNFGWHNITVADYYKVKGIENDAPKRIVAAFKAADTDNVNRHDNHLHHLRLRRANNRIQFGVQNCTRRQIYSLP